MRNSGVKRSRCLLAAIAVVLGLACGDVRAQATNALPTLESLVAQWVALRQAIAAERLAAEAARTRLESETSLLEREAGILDAELAVVEALQAGHSREQVEQIARRERLHEALEAVPPALDRAEADLQAWEQRVPPALRVGLDESFRQLPREGTEARPGRVSERLQTVVALYAGIEALDNSLHVVKEMLADGQGGRLEVDVLYLGLGRAFAVSTDNRWAAVGVPGDAGWTWTAQPALAGAVRQALAIRGREQRAAWVSLPLGVGEAAP